eukprot:SAG22_NODE_6445_length_854_cov_1.621192_2_plen_151_part_01
MNGVDDGYTADQKYGQAGASIVKHADIITKNMWINGYNGVWTIDHDDGSQYWNDTANVMVWGGCKNYLGHSKSCDHNLIVHPGNARRSAGEMPCQVASGVFANQYHDNNKCLTVDGRFYAWESPKEAWRDCNAGSINGKVYETFENTLFAL